MAIFNLHSSFLLLLLPFIVTVSRISSTEAESSFSFASSRKDATFASEDLSLTGKARLVGDGSSIQMTDMTDSVSHGGGQVVFKKPIDYVNTETDYTAGFLTRLSFSMRRGLGGRLGFVVFPVNGTLNRSFFEVKFDTSENFTKFGDSNVGIIVDVTTVLNKTRNFTIANFEKKKLYAWINYLGGGKFLEVRISESDSYESVDPVVFYWTDLSEMLNGEDEFMVGLRSDSGSFSVHSWSLEARRVFKPEHSYAALMLSKYLEEEAAKKRKRRETMWEIVTCFVVTIGFTGLVFFTVMHIRAAFKRNNLAMGMMSEERGLKTKEFGYEKMQKVEVECNDDVKQERK